MILLLTLSLSFSRNLCSHGKSHSGLAEFGASTDPDVQRTSGEPVDASAAESTAHGDRAAPSSTTATTTSTTTTTEPCPATTTTSGNRTGPEYSAAAASPASTTTAAATDPRDAQAQVALLSALQ